MWGGNVVIEARREFGNTDEVKRLPFEAVARGWVKTEKLSICRSELSTV
jgi:hypothetical protein